MVNNKCIMGSRVADSRASGVTLTLLDSCARNLTANLYYSIIKQKN